MLDFTNRSVLKIPVGLTIDQLPSHRNEMAQAKAGNQPCPDLESKITMTVEGYKKLIQNPKNGKNLYWTTDLNTELPIKMGASGLAAHLVPETISEAFIRASKIRNSSPALLVQRNGKDLMWTWNQYLGDALAFAKGLEHFGIDQRSSVNIMGFNSPEWAISVMGSVLHNNIFSGVYTTNADQACQYQAENSQAQVIVVDSIQLMNLYARILNNLPNIKLVIAWNVNEIPKELQTDKRFVLFKEFMIAGEKVEDSKIEANVKQQRPGECCCLIYTSGTTGNPKGVMLSHDNLLFNASSICYESFVNFEPDQMPDFKNSRILSYLPLSHIAGLATDLIGPMVGGSQVYFARPDALQGTLVESIKWCRPTLFIAVPRIWEKFEDKLKEIASSKPRILQSISSWAKGNGQAKVMAQQKGEEAPLMYSIANFLILKRIKEAIGLDQTIMFAFGAAPLKKSTIDYFASLDIPLFNMYGLSETTGTTTINYLDHFSLRHAGVQMSGSHIKIADPDEKGEGEIRVKGRHIMLGYLNNEEATIECMDEEGYFKSGDRGRIDEGGFLQITGRIKELIITAGGENIAPVPIEENFKFECPACSNIMILGEQKRFIAALITFKVDIDLKTGSPTNKLIPEAIQFFKEKAGVNVSTTEEACKSPEIQKLIQICIDATNLKSVSRAAHIKKFNLIPTDFSLPGGELTPTMKLRRKVTEKKYENLVNEIYKADAKL